jgi:hypothetical protein
MAGMVLAVCGPTWGQKKASNPNPAHGAAEVAMPLFRWTAGSTAVLHNVYLGKTPQLGAEHLVGSRQPLAMFYYTGGLEPGVTYYWRVDEIELDMVTIHTGDVWMFLTQALTAYRPSPADGATIVPPAPVLSWLAGRGAVQHRVYFSDNRDAVSQAAAGADKGLLPLATTTFTPGTLPEATTYYWRVDEVVSAGISAGPVWTFSTWRTVDDFETYTDAEGSRIYETWIDGWTNKTGSTVGYNQAPFAEQKIIHGGKQSLPLDYNNVNSPFCSEAELDFSPTQDWTAGGTEALVLFVQGRGVDFDLLNAATAPVIDAKVDDVWATAPILPLRTTISGAAPSAPADASAQFRVLYDATNLYVLADVNDDALRNDSASTWQDDSVEIYIDGANAKGQPPLAGTNRQHTFGWTDTVIAGTNTSVTGVQFAQVNTPTGWRIEIKFPWQSLIGAGAPVGRLIGIDCFYNDDDDGGDTRETQIAWHSTAGGDWQTPASWGTTMLVPPGAGASADRLYVTLQDSSNRSAVVTHPDAAVLKATAWTEWKIPLGSFTGVNLARVKKMTIGVGDKAKPAPGRLGKVFVDDVCLVKP